jgi:hypothetical protein
MSDYRTTTPSNTTVSTRRESGSGALWFIVGGIVVALAVIGYFLTGGELGVTSSTTAPAGAPAGDVSISIEDNASPAPTVEAPPPEAAPAPVETAPADTALPETAPAGN